jgi:sigma-B regulation protein RsbU (phosphoserine phosphatase)
MAIQVTDLQVLRDQLLIRREKLGTAIAKSQTANLVQLLEQVDKALEKVDAGTYGVCEHCLGTVEAERLMTDPLAKLCLDCLNPSEARALEQDLALAARIQAGLLPRADTAAAGWNVAFHYQAAGLVSGDYCDLMSYGKDLYFMVGDVSGKGVAASLLMANLHAMFRALIPTGLPLPQLIGRANRIFSESTLPMQYATLVLGRAGADGEVEICNGGHLAPLHIGAKGVQAIQASALPVGMFLDQEFPSIRLNAAPGDSLVVFTDGFTESSTTGGSEYGDQRLGTVLEGRHGNCARQLLDACMKDHHAFRNGTAVLDDQTVMVLNFAPGENPGGAIVH